MWPRVAEDVILLIGVGSELGIFVPPGADEDDVPVLFLHLAPVLDHLGREERQLVEFVTQIDDHPFAIEPLQRKLVDRLTLGYEVPPRTPGGSHAEAAAE